MATTRIMSFIVATHTDRKHIHNVRPDRAMRKAV